MNYSDMGSRICDFLRIAVLIDLIIRHVPKSSCVGEILTEFRFVVTAVVDALYIAWSDREPDVPASRRGTGQTKTQEEGRHGNKRYDEV